MRHEFPGCGGTIKIWQEENGPIRHVVELGPGATGIYVMEQAYEREILRLAAENRALRSSPGATIVSGAERIAELEEENRTLDSMAQARQGTIKRLEEEARQLRADNLSLVNRLETEGVRVLALRLEVETLKLEVKKQLRRVEDRTLGMESLNRIRERLAAENAALRTDLAAAIKTGEEQAEKIHNLQMRLDDHLDAEAGIALNEAFEARDKARLSRLDVLLASEEVPEGLVLRMKIHSSIPSATAAAWRWFRGQFGGK